MKVPNSSKESKQNVSIEKKKKIEGKYILKEETGTRKACKNTKRKCF